MWNFPSSSSVVLPVRKNAFTGDPTEYFEPLIQKNVKFVTLVNDLNIHACTFTWRSYAWQVKRFGHRAQALGPGIRAFADTHALPILVVAALKAFWMMDAAEIKAIAIAKGIELSDPTCIVAILFDVLKKLLVGKTAEEIMQIIAQRLAGFDAEMQYFEDILNMDEAVAVLSKDDKDFIIINFHIICIVHL